MRNVFKILFPYCVGLVIGLGLIHLIRNNKTDTQLIESLQDSVRMYKKEGKNVSTTSVIETSKSSDFTKLKIKDEEIKKLQNLVKKYEKKLKSGGSVTQFKTITDTKIVTKTITKYDTIRGEIYPIYEGNINKDGWITGNIIATKDSIDANLKVKNEYSVIIGRESQGLFKPKKPFVEIINENPYTLTPNVKTYNVIIPNPKFGIGPFVGYGINSELKPGVFIGIGINYNLIKW